MRTLFVGGTVVGPDLTQRAELLVDGERIAAIGPALPREDARVVDAAGCYLLPGGIDVHTHLDMPLGDIASTDDFATGHVAAACGGTTTHLDFVIQMKGRSLREALEAWHARAAGKAAIDYGFHMTIVDPRPEVLDEIARLPEWGVTTVKVLMAYKGRAMLDDAQLLAVMRRAAASGLLTMTHCENGELIDVLQREALAAGRRAPRDHALTRPAALEAEATARAIAIAALARAPLYVVHLTCEGALQQVRLAQAAGAAVTAETCVQYLFCTVDDLDRPDFEGAKYVCSPPFRTPRDQEALWAGLRDGALAVVSTDHCPFNFGREKQRGRDDFTQIPSGVPAIEDRLLMLYHGGVNGGRLSLSRFVELTATAPAKIFGLYPRKGVLAVGSDADIVLWNPRARRTLSARTHHMAVDYNLFEGTVVTGAPDGTWVRGVQVADRDRFIGRHGAGRFLPRGGAGGWLR
ncbi:MAG TPA: dihydropyrimidinase [bacterium]|nr:dihydropyrimidinase [bacterium]